LIDSDYAYVVNGSVYFDISKFKDYGKLSHNPIEQLMAGAGGRVEQNPDKRSQLDFALWIADPQHVMKWESPWSVGYPGWHIECSVMSMKYLGPTIDIHTGGEDNMFPHHECEIAQSEAASGRQFVRYWMHPLHLLVNGEKMSKSKGNFYTLRDLIAKGYSARDFRYTLLSAHYRDNMNFTFQSLDAAKKTVDGLVDFIDRLSEIKTEATWSEELHNAVFKAKEEFETSMDNDLNTPKALAAVHDLTRATNRSIDAGTASGKNLKEVKEMMQKFDSVLGVLEHDKKALPPDLQGLFDAREAARKNKDFKAADRIRAELAEKGVILEDQPTGTRWRWAQI
jgi:cysteinyl-tRNA synthetase